jgi:hypothetical protein
MRHTPSKFSWAGVFTSKMNLTLLKGWYWTSFVRAIESVYFSLLRLLHRILGFPQRRPMVPINKNLK